MFVPDSSAQSDLEAAMESQMEEAAMESQMEEASTFSISAALEPRVEEAGRDGSTMMVSRARLNFT